jgi:uncharacterized protein (DUF2267 family)
MSSQGLEVIDHTVQLTHEWINDLAARLDWSSQRDVLRLLRVTLRQIRDHLGHAEVAQFSAQMPLLVRGMFFEGWTPAHTPIRDRRADHFVAAISAQLGDVQGWRGADDIAAVFMTLNTRISPGEIADIKAGLPMPIRHMWPEREGVQDGG